MCADVKRRLVDLVPVWRRKEVLVRVACYELEAWALGDWSAVARAFEKPALAANANKAAYRNPDNERRPVEELRKFVSFYQKRDGARRVGGLLDPQRNNSSSFRAFCEGIRRILETFD